MSLRTHFVFNFCDIRVSVAYSSLLFKPFVMYQTISGNACQGVWLVSVEGDIMPTKLGCLLVEGCAWVLSYSFAGFSDYNFITGSISWYSVYSGASFT